MATPTENNNPAANENTPAENTPAATPAATPPANPPASAPAQNQGFDASELLTALNALPEKIVNGIREATLPARQPATPKTDTGTKTGGNAAQTAAQTAQSQSQQTTQNQPQKKSFADWWFGN